MNAEAIRKNALRLVHKYKTRDPFLICEKLNITVLHEPLPDNIRGIYSRVLRRPYITINCRIDAYWQRFICAHELGHHRLKHPLNGMHHIDRDIFRIDKYEFQANLFAALLLFEEKYGFCLTDSSWFRDLLHEATKYKDSRRLAHFVFEAMEEYI